MQRDTTGLSAENAELKIRLQAMEQHAQLRDGEHCSLIEDNIIYLSMLCFLVFFPFPGTLSNNKTVEQFLALYNKKSSFFLVLVPFSN